MTEAIMSAGALFDLDGVLIDSEGIYTEFWRDVADKFPCACELSGCDTSVGFAMHIKGNTLENILANYFPNQAARAEILQLLRHHELTMEYRLFEGVYDLLEGLRSAGIPAAIVTSSNGVKMRHMVEQLPEFAAYFGTIVTGDDVTASKPDPQGYLMAARRLGCRPEHCVVFEDSLAGIEAGRLAGCRVVGLATTLPTETIRRASPDMVVDSLCGVDVTDIWSEGVKYCEYSPL